MKPGYRPEQNYTPVVPGQQTKAESKPVEPLEGRTGVTGTVTSHSGRKAKQGSQGRLDSLKAIGDLLE